MTTAADIAKGDRCTVNRYDPWLRKPKLDDRVARVMAVAEGYAMLRYKGAAPFLASVSDLHKVTGET
jgi:hypothetical protein